MLIKLRNVRLEAWPVLFEATAFQGEGEPAYQAKFGFDKSSKVLGEDRTPVKLTDILPKVASEKWKDKSAAVLKELVAKDKVCIRENEGGEMILSSRRKEEDGRPTVIDRDLSPLAPADGRPYGGCIVNAEVEVWAQDNKFGKRINCILKGVQFVKDGEPLSGTPPASVNDFDAEEDDGSDLV